MNESHDRKRLRWGMVLMGVVALVLIAGVLYLGEFTKDKDGRPWARASEPVATGIPEPLFEVRLNGLRGFMNAEGRVVIAPAFEWIGRFSEGVCAAKKGGLTGYIDGTGAWVISPAFAMAGGFREGRAAVRETYTGGYGYIDRSGRVVIPYQYDSAGEFVDGVARVGHATRMGKILSSFADVGVECWYEFIDMEGKVVDRPASVRAGSRDSATEAPMLIPFGTPGKMGYRDASGRVVVEAIYDRTDAFVHGFGCVGLDGGRRNGYVDAEGRVVWKPTE